MMASSWGWPLRSRRSRTRRAAATSKPPLRRRCRTTVGRSSAESWPGAGERGVEHAVKVRNGALEPAELEDLVRAAGQPVLDRARDPEVLGHAARRELRIAARRIDDI